MKTYMAKPGEVERKWYVIDAEGKTLGRLATQIAAVLRGKHKPQYTPHVDTGDFVIVVNAERVVLTGRKLDQKKYHWHTGYPGGIKDRTARRVIEGRFPERVVEKAVERMLPRGPLGRQQLKNLRVYAEEQARVRIETTELLPTPDRSPARRRLRDRAGRMWRKLGVG